MPQTWRSARIAKNASIWYLGICPQNEAKLAHKEEQPHCSECGPVGKRQNNGNQSIHCLISKESALKENFSKMAKFLTSETKDQPSCT